MEYYSASRIKKLSDCRKAFYHKYIVEDLEREDSPFAQLGTALHRVLELWRQETNRDRKWMSRVFLDSFEPGSGHFLFQEGRRILWGLDLKKVVLGELVATEFEFEEVVQGFPVHGVIDKIEKVGDKLVITDYKSNKAMNANEYVTQLAIYDAALENLYPGSVREHELLYLRYNKSVPFIFSDKSHQKVKQIFESTQAKIEVAGTNANNWPKLKSKSKVCAFCPLAGECW